MTKTLTVIALALGVGLLGNGCYKEKADNQDYKNTANVQIYDPLNTMEIKRVEIEKIERDTTTNGWDILIRLNKNGTFDFYIDENGDSLADYQWQGTWYLGYNITGRHELKENQPNIDSLEVGLKKGRII